MAPPGIPPPLASLALVGALAGSLAGCVQVYQPMSGLHRPIAVDPGMANFADLDVTVICPPGPALDSTDAGRLCRYVARLFENQGARVETRIGPRPPLDAEPEGAPDPDAPIRAALTIELTARVVHREATDYGLWETVTDYTVAQDVVIRDGFGFLLVRDTLTGRFTRRLGIFSDAEEDFSADFYGQLSQLALNAKVRRRVLAEGRGAR